MSNEEIILSCCGGSHEPDTSDMELIYGDWVFSPPFKCMCCGKDICARQFAWGRTCGPCDMGGCDPANQVYSPHYGHPRPPWRATNKERWAAFLAQDLSFRAKQMEAFALHSGITGKRHKEV